MRSGSCLCIGLVGCGTPPYITYIYFCSRLSRRFTLFVTKSGRRGACTVTDAFNVLFLTVFLRCVPLTRELLLAVLSREVVHAQAWTGQVE